MKTSNCTTYKWWIKIFHPVVISILIVLGISANNVFAELAIRVNAGGGNYTDGAGRLWQTDTGFNTGSSASTTSAISGTVDDPLYRTERWDPVPSPDLLYSFSVPAGWYRVNLHFAEIYSGAFINGGRIFDVTIENKLVLDDLDIYAEVGANAVLVKGFDVEVVDGQLNIQFGHNVESPKIAAIEIVQLAQPPQQAVQITSTPPTTATVGKTYSYDVDAAGMPAPVYSLDIAPTSMSINAVTGLIQWTPDADGEYDVTVRAANGIGQDSTQYYTISAAAASQFAVRVNAGGGSYADGAGRLWQADTGFNTGSSASTTSAISGTVDDPLYRTERWDPVPSPDLLYSFSVPAGWYRVNLHFAEIYSGAFFNGGRIFDVTIENKLVLDDLDIYAEVGANAALVKGFDVEVVDGQLNIQFGHNVESPKIAAIEIVQLAQPPQQAAQITSTPPTTATVGKTYSYDVDAAGMPAPVYSLDIAPTSMSINAVTGLIQWTPDADGEYDVTVRAANGIGQDSTQYYTISAAAASQFAVRVNAGGGSYADGAGRLWQADTGFNTGSSASTTSAISGTVDDPLYRTERWDPVPSPDLIYSFSVPAGWYHVNLHFAEIYSGAFFNGGRIFDVAIENKLVLDDLDIYAEVGANAALVKGFDVEVVDGQLNIQFGHNVESPKIAAIEIVQLAQPPQQAPQIVSIPITESFIGAGYRYRVAATGFPVPQFQLTESPTGMAVNPATGLITWIPSNVGTFNVTVVASNGIGPADNQSFSISVANTGALPSGLITFFRYDYDIGAEFENVSGSSPAFCVSTCPAVVDGKINGAIGFDGLNSELSIAANSNFNWSSNGSFTIEFWMKTGQTTPLSSNQIIVGRDDAASDLHWWAGIDTLGKPVFQLRDVTGAGVYLVGKKMLTNNVWHHLALVRDAAFDENRIYVDGVLDGIAKFDYASGFGSNNAAIDIGWLNLNVSVSGGYHFRGAIDELAIYDKALSINDIRQHYFLARSYDADGSIAIKIMPLGDSITYDNYPGETRPVGERTAYRQQLWLDLKASGHNVDFVGSQIAGQDIVPSFDPDNEGHPGWRDDQIATTVYNFLSLNPADVILLHIGTNLLTTNPNDVKDILNEIDAFESDYHRDVTVILARIINRAGYLCGQGSTTTTFNNNVQNMAMERINNGDKIIIVDMECGAGIDYRLSTAGGDMNDLLHPIANGYFKMATKWYEMLVGFLP